MDSINDEQKEINDCIKQYTELIDYIQSKIDNGYKDDDLKDDLIMYKRQKAFYMCITANK